MGITNISNITGILAGFRDVEVIDFSSRLTDYIPAGGGCIVYVPSSEVGASLIYRPIDGSSDFTETIGASGGTIRLGDAHPIIVGVIRSTSTADNVQIGLL